ncbi:hypothetical protein GPEL0_01f0837 [Geoanaerobacter pelophilus]|uniref:Putative zinc-finger domain-containing protein n=1 Tax=Geoanaerobacter pelophilus TaxID=60036 RepID=A0ABQ0MFL3_9BACT|nr:zf-HC2 domain-containing protein [Geoanaerobacter pelophilus]GAW65788.1 hypothetical protein GPEL0_01f0837 [Geoanaerobacter pelophilus]
MKKDDSALGTALTRGFTDAEPAEECPALETVAGLVDGSISGKERDRVLGHLASCDHCRELFIASSQLSDAPAQQKRHRLLFPSAFAAAAVLVIAVTLQLRTVEPERGMVARSEQAASPQTVASAERNGGPLPAKEMAQLPGTKRERVPAREEIASAAAERKAGGIQQVSAPDGARLARLLMAKGDPAQLASLSMAQDKNFGFATSADASSVAFRIGVNLMNLEVELIAGDGDRAQAQAARLAPLLESLAGAPDRAPLEGMVAQLERGVDPSTLAGASGELERLVPSEQVPYARLGAWAQGARLAAKTGNRDYLAAGVPRYFGNKVADQGVPVPAVLALKELDQRLKRPGNLDLDLVEKELFALLQAF